MERRVLLALLLLLPVVFQGGCAGGGGNSGVTLTAESQTQVVASITFETTVLPSAVINAPYTATITVTGGTAPITFTVASGSTLPNGIQLNGSTGVLSGTPLASGSFTFTIQATGTASGNTAPATGSQQFTLTVNATVQPLTFITTSLSNALVNQMYTGMVNVTGGLTPYTFSVVSGNLPPGLLLVTTNSEAAVTGTPTQSGTFTFTVQVKDSSATPLTTTQKFTLSVSNPLAFATTSPLPMGFSNAAYSTTINGTGGAPPYTFSLSSGTLPAGLTLNSSGLLSGTPTQTGTFTFTVKVVDSGSQSATQQFQLTISASVAIQTQSVSNGVMATAFAATIVAGGGTGPYTFSVSSGALPPGLSLTPGTTSAQVTGTPTQAGTFTFAVQVKDSSNPVQSATQSFSITVYTPLAIGTPSLADGITGTAYSGSLNASGGVSPYTTSVSSGALPPGLSGQGASVAGTPGVAGTFNFVLKVTDSGVPAQSVTHSYTVEVDDPIVVTSTTLLPFAVNNALNNNVFVQATGGHAPLSFALANGSAALPAGLSLASNGNLTGTPTAGGQTTITVQVTDPSAPADIQQSVSSTVTVTIISLPFSIHTLRLPVATANVSYNAAITVGGGSPPYSAQLAPASVLGEANNSQLPDNSELSNNGVLPPGITLSASGTSVTLAGTPTTNGFYEFVVQVSDSASEVAYQILAINVGGVTPPAPPNPPQFSNLFECQRTSLPPAAETFNQTPPAGTLPFSGCSAIPSPNDPIPPLYDGTPATVYTDPVFGTKIKRLTPPASTPGVYAPIYSPIEAWSATGKFLIVSGPGGDLYLFSGIDPYTFIRRLNDVPQDGVDQASALWDNSNDCIYYDTFRQSIRAINVCNNDNITVIGTFPTLTDTQGNVLNLTGNTESGSPLPPPGNFNPSGPVNPLVIKPYVYCHISDDNKMLATKITDGQGIVYGFATFDLTQLNTNYFMHKLTSPGDLVNKDVNGNVVTPVNKEPAQACISPDGDYVAVAWNTPTDASPDNGPYTHGGSEQFDAKTGAPITRTGAFIPGLGFPCILAPCADTNYITSDFDTHQDQIRLADGSEGIFSAFCGSDLPGPSISFVEYTVYSYNPLLSLGCTLPGPGVTPSYLPDASNLNGAWHTSGRNATGPDAVTRGWGLVSSFGFPTGVDGFGAGQVPMGSELFALKMDGSNVIRRIAHDQTCRQQDYFAEPHASPSRDFHHALFGSNWRDCSGAVSDQVYIVEIP